MSLTELVDGIVADGKLTQAEKRELDQALLADGQLSPDEQQKLAELLTKIATGELRIVD